MEGASAARAGIVVAGGYGTRFGPHEKALAELSGRPLLGHVLDGLAPAVDGVVVNCRREQVPDLRRVLEDSPVDVALVCDRTPDRGPAAGLATALSAVRAPLAAVVGCDTPFLDGDFLEFLFDAVGEAEAAVPRLDGRPRPLHAVVRPGPARRAGRRATLEGTGSLREVLDRLDVAEIPESRVLAETARRTFTDVNTPGALDAAGRD